VASSLRPAKHLASQKSGRFEPDKFEELAYYETALIDPHPSKARRRADHAEKNRKAREFATFARSFLKGMEQLLWWCGKRFCRREMRPRPGLYRSETPARLTNSRLRTIGAEGPASRSGGLARRRPSVFNLLPAYISGGIAESVGSLVDSVHKSWFLESFRFDDEGHARGWVVEIASGQHVPANMVVDLLGGCLALPR
jgi:hypothetical protein